jgi:DNA-directed RNA polymerase I, II, and III subunit RPABC1
MSECPNTHFLSFSETSSIEILYRVYTNLLDMLKARKYSIDPEDIKASNLEEFKNLFNDINDPDISILQMIVEKPNLLKKEGEEIESEKVAIFWTDVEKIGVRQIKSYIDFMDENNVNHSIIMLKHSITTFALRTLEDFNTNFPDKFIEYFEYSECLINITNHILVPHHFVLNSEEKAEIIKKYQLKKEAQLPKLFRTDAISRYYGLKKGDVVKVIRPSTGSTSYITYRVVV